MDFVVGLNTTMGGYNSIWVIVYRVTKCLLHFGSSDIYGREFKQALHHLYCTTTRSHDCYCL